MKLNEARLSTMACAPSGTGPSFPAIRVASWKAHTSRPKCNPTGIPIQAMRAIRRQSNEARPHAVQAGLCRPARRSPRAAGRAEQPHRGPGQARPDDWRNPPPPNTSHQVRTAFTTFTISTTHSDGATTPRPARYCRLMVKTRNPNAVGACKATKVLASADSPGSWPKAPSTGRVHSHKQRNRHAEQHGQHQPALEGQGHGLGVARAIGLAQNRIGPHDHAHGNQDGSVRPGVAQRDRRQGRVSRPAHEQGLHHAHEHHAHLRRHER
jgi:hypothetical protein